MIVSPAVSRDIENIAQAAQEFAKNGYPTDKCCEDHIWTVIRDAMDNTNALVAVLRDEGEFAGCFLGVVGPHVLTGKLSCAEIFFWVEPRYRGHGRKLLDYVQKLALQRGCSELVLSAPQSAERAATLFRRWGFKPAETWYRKELKCPYSQR